MTQAKTNPRAREYSEAAARLRVDSDWQKLADMIRDIQAGLDDILRTQTDHDTLMRAAGGHRQLQELLDYVDNQRVPDTRPRSGRAF